LNRGPLLYERESPVSKRTAELRAEGYRDNTMRCPYCERPATIRIVAVPEHVCFDHAVEFWHGLMVYARDNSGCVKYERLCFCTRCEESRMRDLRAAAIAVAGPAPRVRERVRMRLAS